MSIRTERSGDCVTVISDYWQVGIDTGRGGVIDRIIFPHGANENLVASPLQLSVDDARDTAGSATEVTLEEAGGGQRITCRGVLRTPAGQPTEIGYEHIYQIDEDVFLVRSTLNVPTEIAVRSVGVGEGAFSASLGEFGYRPSPWDDPLEQGKWCRAIWGDVPLNDWPFLEARHIPVYWMLFNRYIDGLDWTPASNYARWTDQFTPGEPGRAYFALAGSKRHQRIDLTCKVLESSEPVMLAAGSYEFAYYLGLPKIMERTPRKWYHLSFGNHPSPSDETIAQWAEAGVNAVRLHNDYMADGNFWHDGMWPPYDEQGMVDMRRVIDTCHRHDLFCTAG